MPAPGLWRPFSARTPGLQPPAVLLLQWGNQAQRGPIICPSPSEPECEPTKTIYKTIGKYQLAGGEGSQGGGESAALWELELEEEEKEEQGSSASVVAQCVGSPRATEVLLGQSVIGAGHGREGPEMVDFLQVELGHPWQREELRAPVWEFPFAVGEE